MFFPAALETLGPVNVECPEFLSEMGRRVVAFHLSLEINAKPISSCNTFPSVCIATMPSHAGEHFRMVVNLWHLGQGLISLRKFLLLT